MKTLFKFSPLALLAIAGASHAAVDVAAVVTEINGALAPIGTIAAAVLLVLVGLKTFKWIARAF